MLLFFSALPGFAAHLFLLLPGFVTGLCAVNIRQLAQTEAVQTGGVRVAVHCDPGVAVGHLKGLPHLLVQLKVSNGATELRGWKGK